MGNTRRKSAEYNRLAGKLDRMTKRAEGAFNEGRRRQIHAGIKELEVAHALLHRAMLELKDHPLALEIKSALKET